MSLNEIKYSFKMRANMFDVMIRQIVAAFLNESFMRSTHSSGIF